MSRWRLWLLVTLVALAVRTAVLVQLGAYPRQERILNRLDDQTVFDSWARAIAHGEAFDYATTGHEFARWAALRPGVFPQAPLYPWFVGGIYRLSGDRPDAVRAVQAAFGAGAAGGVAVLASFVASPPAAAVAGLAAAFYGPEVFYGTTLLRAGLLGSVSVFALLVAMIEGRGPPDRTAASTARRLGLGALLAAGVLLRPTFLLVAAVLGLWLARRRGVRPLAIVALPLVVLLGAVAATNTLRSGSPAFLSSNGPYIFYVSNAPDASGVTAAPPPSYRELVAARPAAEIDLVRETFAAIRRDPGAWVGLEARKLAAFFALQEIPNNVSYELGAELDPALRIPFVRWWHVAPWAFLGVGLALSRRRTRAETAPLLLFVAAWVAGTIAFYVLGRLRQPAMLVLLVFAALALDLLLAEMPRRPARAVALGTVLALATLAIRPAPPVHRPADYEMAAAASYTEALVRLDRGDLARARRELIDAVVRNPSHERARVLLAELGAPAPPPDPEVADTCRRARLAFEAGKPREALRDLRAVARRAPAAALPHQFLANVLHLEGRTREAIRAQEEALRRHPLDPLLGRNLEALRREARLRPVRSRELS